METYNAKKRTSAKLRKLIEETLAYHSKYKNAYFWTPDSSASGRRQREKRFPMKDFDIETSKGLLSVRTGYSESCKNCYYFFSVELDGKKKDIRALKALI